MKKSLEMPCIRGFKAKLLLRHLMNYQRNLLGTLNKNVFVKKLSKLKKRGDNVKFNKLVVEMLRKLLELVSNVFMKKS